MNGVFNKIVFILKDITSQVMEWFLYHGMEIVMAMVLWLMWRAWWENS